MLLHFRALLQRTRYTSGGHHARPGGAAVGLALGLVLGMVLTACAPAVQDQTATCDVPTCQSPAGPPSASPPSTPPPSTPPAATPTPPPSGSADATFGGTGAVVQQSVVGGLYDIGNAVVFDSLGRIVVAGSSQDTSVPPVQYAVVYRFNPDGTLDGTFGTGGIQTQKNTAGGTYNDSGNSVAVDSSDRVLVAGESADLTIPSEWMAVWRFDTTGKLDGTFGGTGFLLANNANSDGSTRDAGFGIALDASGNILVAGNSRGSPAIEMALWRVLPTGTLDPAFNGAGSQSDYFGASPGQNAGFLPLALSNTDIVVTGFSNPGNVCNSMPIWHYSNTGVLLGASQSPTPGCGDSGTAILEDASGNLVVVGSSTVGTVTSMAIWRYVVAGTPTLDTTFAGTGVVYRIGTVAGSNTEVANSAALDSLGRIVAVGYVQTATATYATIWRYNPDGTVDTSFGSTGQGYVATTGTAGSPAVPNDQARQIRIDSSGRYVVAGSSVDSSGNTRMVTWRVNP